MPKSRLRKGVVGHPFHPDAEKLLAVRKIKAEHPKWHYYTAALRFAEEHPEPDAKPTSTARRLARKLKQEDGVPTKRNRTRKVLLREIEELLSRAALIAGYLRKFELGHCTGP